MPRGQRIAFIVCLDSHFLSDYFFIGFFSHIPIE